MKRYDPSFESILLIYFLSSFKIRDYIKNAFEISQEEKIIEGKARHLISLKSPQYFPQVFNFPSIYPKVKNEESEKYSLKAQDFYNYLIKPKRLSRLENFLLYFSSSIPLFSFLKNKLNIYYPEITENKFLGRSLYEWTYENFEEFCNSQLENYFSFVKSVMEIDRPPYSFTHSLLWEKIKAKCFVDLEFKERVTSIIKSYIDSLKDDEIKEIFVKKLNEIKNMFEIIERYKSNKEEYKFRLEIITFD